MFRAGQQIGIYTLINRIGRGGFGEVWLAERRAKFSTTQVAIKLPLDEQVDHAAIEQEAKLWAQASGHPNVLPIIEADDYNGQIVIVSEYAPDGSLEQLLKNNGGSLPVSQAVELTAGVLKGLEFLHSRKIIHRDLKPANILLQGDTPRLADFGISRTIRTLSVSANIAGTPKYMAPEAFDGKRNVQSDIWSVGILLYQMLTGRLPFPQEHNGELIGAIVGKEPEPLPETFPLALRRIVSKALSKNPTERYSSAREMRTALDGKVKEQSVSTVIHPVPPLSTTKRTNHLYFTVPAVLFLLFVTISIFSGITYWMLHAPSSSTINTASAGIPPTKIANIPHLELLAQHTIATAQKSRFPPPAYTGKYLIKFTAQVRNEGANGKVRAIAKLYTPEGQFYREQIFDIESNQDKTLEFFFGEVADSTVPAQTWLSEGKARCEFSYEPVQ